MKNEINGESLPSSEFSVPELPAVLTSVDGRSYDITGSTWILPRDLETEATVKFVWRNLTDITVIGGSTPVMSERAVNFIKLYILDRMTAAQGAINPHSGINIVHSMVHLANWQAAHSEFLTTGRGFEWGDLTEDMFDAWLAAEYGMKRKGNSARHVRNFYLWGADPDAMRPDFSTELASVLRAKRIKLSPDGEVVESRDPRRGPFTREELELITRACEAGMGGDQDRAIAWTLRQTGIRPLQLSKLRNQDLELIQCEGDEGLRGSVRLRVTHQLRVRKIKQRSKVVEYHYLPLSEGCARLLLNLRRPGSGPDERLFWWVTSSYGDDVRCSLESFSKDANLRSPRLPIKEPKPGGPIFELMPLTARRFRYSVATELVSLGENSENVAAILGHKGTSDVHVYVETSPKIADDFQRATDYAVSPLIALMEGRAQPSDVDLLAEPGPITLKFRPHDEKIAFTNESFHHPYNKRAQPTGTATSAAQRPNKSEARIENLIVSGRRRFPQTYPSQNFDSQVWNVANLRERPNATNVANFGFTKLGTNLHSGHSTRPEDALPTYFVDVIKSWLVLESNVSLQCRSNRLYAARYFWSFLSMRAGDGNEFVWGDLSEDDMLWFEQFLIAYRTTLGAQLHQNTIHLIISHVQGLVDFLFSRGICGRINYVPQTRRKSPASSIPLDEKKYAAEMKLPAPGVLETLGSIYHRLTTSPAGEVSDWMLIVISAVAILMLTGLRIGELVTLPYDCEVEEQLPEAGSDDSFSLRYGIRYWVEKTGKKMMRVKWISPTAESIVRASIARIKCLTAAARERAKILEADPTRVTLPPEIASRIAITGSELFALLGWRWKPCYSSLPKLLPPRGRGRDLHFDVKDLEKYLLAKRKTLLHTVRHDDGSVQKLSESRLIIFNKQSRCRQMDACRLLVEPVSANTITYYLSSGTNLFKTYGDTEEQRSLSTCPHSFRHWLIHVAYMGGMKTELILRYFAKRYTSGVADYLHFSTNESGAYAPEELRTQRFYVPE